MPQWKQGYALVRSGIQIQNLESFHTHPFSLCPMLSETIGPAVSFSSQTNLLGLFRGYPGHLPSGLHPVTCSCQVLHSVFSLGARISTARFWCYGTRLYLSQLVLREHGTNCLSLLSLGARCSTTRLWCYGTLLYPSQLVLREHGKNCHLCSDSSLYLYGTVSPVGSLSSLDVPLTYWQLCCLTALLAVALIAPLALAWV